MLTFIFLFIKRGDYGNPPYGFFIGEAALSRSSPKVVDDDDDRFVR